MTIHILKALQDNYIYLVEHDEKYLVIDPSEEGPVIEFLEKKQVELDAILITHRHSDHVGGVPALLEKYKPKIYATDYPFDFQVNTIMKEGVDVNIIGLDVQTLATPGHTLDHLVYYFPQLKCLMSGDTVFGGGCGKLFEGSAKQMHQSFEKIKTLPLETKIYFGHEYTLANLRFAQTVDPKNTDLSSRENQAEKEKVTTPSTLELELKTNPYFRVDDSSVKEHLQMEGAKPDEVFAKIRLLKDNF